MTNQIPQEGSGSEFSKWQLIKSWTMLALLAAGLMLGVWMLFFKSDTRVFVIQGVNDDCFRKLMMSSEDGPDEWKMKVCISANNGYVDENGKVIHP